MNPTTWQSGFGSNVIGFETEQFGTIFNNISALTTNPATANISKTDAYYHEYQTTYNTGISTNDVAFA